MLEIRGLRAGYGSVEILRGIDLDVGQGEIVAVLGSNGVGKSTLNNNISALYRPFSGSIRFKGEELVGRSSTDIVKRGVIHVPEGRAGQLQPGMAARVRTWAAPEREYAASVREVAPAADAATRTYALRVAVPQADAGLPLGATASVMFAVPDADGGGVLLPLAAVTGTPGRPGPPSSTTISACVPSRRRLTRTGWLFGA